MAVIRFTATILRKQASLPRYIVVTPSHVSGHDRAFEAEVSLNGGPVFRRNIRPWGKGSDAYFFNVTAEQCAQWGVDTGDEVGVEIAAVSN